MAESNKKPLENWVDPCNDLNMLINKSKFYEPMSKDT